MGSRRPLLWAGLAVALIAGLAVLLILGLSIPDRWATQTWGGGFSGGQISLPPFPPLSSMRLYTVDNPSPNLVPHFYVLGSDGGGRDLLAVTARGAVPSLELVGIALLARMLLGIIAGVLIAVGARWVRTLTRAAGGWIAGFPYLALAVLVITAFTGGPSTIAQPGRARLFGFIVAIAIVGWRDIAEVVAGRVEWVRLQPFALGAKAVGSQGFGYFRRHVWPYLRPALTVEFSYQASAVLVLLAELGFLQYYLGGFTGIPEFGGGGIAYRLANQPELGQLLSDVRIYAIRQELTPALVPALALVLTALAFELLGRAFRGRADLP
jgi:ABC-type dipeptide/oligopeptide/nickel transport system permease subunit